MTIFGSTKHHRRTLGVAGLVLTALVGFAPAAVTLTAAMSSGASSANSLPVKTGTSRSTCAVRA